MENRVGRPKMPRQERAKQFMPFAALKGFEEALRQQELLHEQRQAEAEKGIEDAERC